jgi:hypothetical protein
MPDRAYWYRSKADRKSLIVPLPDPEQDWEIKFTPSQPGPPKPIADEQTGMVVPDHLIRPHRLVQEAKKAKTRTLSNDGRLRMDGGYLKVLVSQTCRNRAFRLMDALIKACESRGWPVRITKGQRPETIVDVHGCDVQVELVEGLRQEPREPLPWEKPRSISPIYGYKRHPYTLVPNGRLKVKVAAVDYWYHGQWGDRTHRRLEDMFDDIIAGIEAGQAAKIQQDKQKAEDEERRIENERLRREEEERQRERQRIRLAEQARIDNLLADAEAWDQSQRLRAYIKACLEKTRRAGKLTGQDIGRESEFGKWLIWARAQADRLDPLVKSPPSILDTEPAPGPPVETRKSFAEIMNSLYER